jgi:hypothetical protein
MSIYGPMIYTAPFVMVVMRADPLRGQVGEAWALEIETFSGLVKWHRAVRRMPFGAKSRSNQGRLQKETEKFKPVIARDEDYQRP